MKVNPRTAATRAGRALDSSPGLYIAHPMDRAVWKRATIPDNLGTPPDPELSLSMAEILAVA